jgi:glycosyltransferase involved in cell wall biosynthesis
MRNRRIAYLLKQHKVQAVLAEFGSAGDGLLRPCREAGIPLVVHFHGKDAHCETNLQAHGHYRQLLKEAAAVIVVSRAMERQLLELGAPRERLHYICYGIDVGRFSAGQPEGQPPRFLSVGRFTDKKAPLITFLAFRQAWLQRPEARLTMIGGGDLWESIRQFRTVFGMEQVVELAGIRSPAEVAVAMRTCRAFVQHSVTTGNNDMEGTPLAVLEAMASGLPVIATRHAGIADVVLHGERGLLSKEYDLEAMARHMVQLTDDPGLASSMGKAGRAYAAAAHRVEIQVAALQSVIDQVARPVG